MIRPLRRCRRSPPRSARGSAAGARSARRRRRSGPARQPRSVGARCAVADAIARAGERSGSGASDSCRRPQGRRRRSRWFVMAPASRRRSRPGARGERLLVEALGLEVDVAAVRRQPARAERCGRRGRTTLLVATPAPRTSDERREHARLQAGRACSTSASDAAAAAKYSSLDLLEVRVPGAAEREWRPRSFAVQAARASYTPRPSVATSSRRRRRALVQHQWHSAGRTGEPGYSRSSAVWEAGQIDGSERLRMVRSGARSRCAARCSMFARRLSDLKLRRHSLLVNKVLPGALRRRAAARVQRVEDELDRRQRVSARS